MKNLNDKFLITTRYQLLKIFQNSLKNICDAVFNLTKFQAKGLQLFWKETPIYVLS